MGYVPRVFSEKPSAIMIGMPVLKASQVVHYSHDSASRLSTVFLATQTTPHHLHVADWTEDCTGNENHVGHWRIKAGAQHRVVAENADFTALESGQKIASRGCGRIATDCGRRNPL